MGQTLSEPVTAKETSSCASKQLKVGSSSMQGWRISMEDAHTHILSLPNDKDASFFAVFDGHGGAKVAEYAGRHLHRRVLETEEYQQGKYDEALKRGFLGLDEEMLADEEYKDEMAGTTAVVVLMKNNKLICANVGDSRAVLSVTGAEEPLSYDHKPANESEARRIMNAGGWVEFNRVNGNLALSRALGDFIFKRNDGLPAEEQIVTASPDIMSHEITDETEFLVLACDGIWDVMSNQDVVDFVRDRLAVGTEPEIICEDLLTHCLAPDSQMGGLGCDNMTVVIVCLLQNLTWKEFCEKCNKPRRESLTDADLYPMMATNDANDDEWHDDEEPTTLTDDQRSASETFNAFVTPPHTPNVKGGGEQAKKDDASDDEQPPQQFEVPPKTTTTNATIEIQSSQQPSDAEAKATVAEQN